MKTKKIKELEKAIELANREIKEWNKFMCIALKKLKYYETH